MDTIDLYNRKCTLAYQVIPVQYNEVKITSLGDIGSIL